MPRKAVRLGGCLRQQVCRLVHRSNDRSWWAISARATALTLRGDVASGDMIALSIEVPPIFDRQDPHSLCGGEVFSRRNLWARELQ